MNALPVLANLGAASTPLTPMVHLRRNHGKAKTGPAGRKLYSGRQGL
jgi:hypothetical protein